MFDEVLPLNKNRLYSDESLEKAGIFFAESKHDEITIVDRTDNPLGILERKAFMKDHRFPENQDARTAPLNSSFNAVVDLSDLHGLILSGSEYCILTDGDGAFEALATKRKLISNYLKQQDSFIFSIFEFASIIRVADTSGGDVYVWKKEADDGGYIEEELPAGVWSGFIRETIENNAPIEGVRVSSKEQALLAYTYPMIQNNRIDGVIGFFFNSLEAFEIVTKISNLQQLYEEVNSIIETSYDGFTIINGEGVVTRVNKSHERITGSRPEDMIGKHVTELVREGELENPVTLRVLKEKKTVTIKQKVRNGKQIIVTGTPVFDKSGAIVRIVCNLRDITELEELQEKLKTVETARSRDRQEIGRLMGQQLTLGNIIANSTAMKDIIKSIDNISEKDVPVLILGETGVGKEIIATLIHKSSLKKSGPFLKVNCGAIPSNLLESELFGYVEGAFTGAVKGGKAGIFESAKGGTVFLDEIGELGLDLQVKLLRVLQEKEVTRVGSSRPIRIDARFIFATNRDLKKMVEHGTFREDLFYRLYVYPISIPALRHRKDDIIPLTDYFIEKFNKKYLSHKSVSLGLKKKLLQYSWPGNVRELENLIERLVISTSGDLIDEDNIAGFGKDMKFREHLRQGDKVIDTGSASLGEAVANFEMQIICEALKNYQTMAAAAESLGVDRTTICRKINKYGIPYPYVE